MIFLVRKALRLNRYGGSEKGTQEQEHRGKAGTSDLKSTVGIVSLFIAYKGKGLLIVAVGACSAVFVAELVLMVVR